MSSAVPRRLVRRALTWLVTATCATGCFAYDSRWLQREEEKKRAAERLRPAQIKAPRRTSASGARVALVRAYATRGYASETLHWERQLDSLLADASRVLEPSLGVVLRRAGTSPWEPESGESEPYSALGDLERLDSGAGVHWVMGLLPSEPKLVTDFHRLGYARYFGKHLVVRGSADPDDIGHLSRYEGLDAAEREEIYSQRKRHRLVAVLLHEIAHTLGAVHRTAKDTLMSPVYATVEQGFDEPTLGLLRISLPARLDEERVESTFTALAAHLEATPDGWVGSERDEMLARLRTQVARAAAQAAPSASALAAPAPETPAEPGPRESTVPRRPLPLSTLVLADRASLDAAAASETAGDIRGAWTTALPLFERHPRVIEVQELRCRLARARRFLAAVVEAHCERLVALGGASE